MSQIVNGIKGQVVTAGSQYALKKVSGILRDIVSPQPTPKTGLDSPEAGKKSTNILQFPMDVTAAPGLGNQGHYVMFFINEQEDAEIQFGTRGNKNAFDDVLKANEEYNIPRTINDSLGVRRVNANGQQTYLNEAIGNEMQNALNSQGRTGSTGYIDNTDFEYSDAGEAIYVKRAPTVRLDTAIALYMPPTATFVDNANYTDTEIGAAAKAGMDIYADVMAGKSIATTVGNSLEQLGPALSEGLTKALLGAVGNIPGFGGMREAYEMAAGTIIADRMELAFKGVAKRVFQFNFKMIPKSQQEADEIRKIIYAFRLNMLPEFKGGNRMGRKLRVPSTFNIQYMYNGGENNYLQKISTCVLENCTVSYGGDRYRTFTPNEIGAPPVETSLTLNFKEMELITKDRVFEGF
tara:strand:- start:199 stop:1419 length:1221 start_codon:yes stop_codon:yes gene_type:complete